MCNCVIVVRVKFTRVKKIVIDFHERKERRIEFFQAACFFFWFILFLSFLSLSLFGDSFLSLFYFIREKEKI